MLYTDEMKKELEEIVRSIDGVSNILWRWDPWVGCNCMRFMVEKRAFRLYFSQEGLPIAYNFLSGYWGIDAERGQYSPVTVQHIITTICNLLDIYDKKEIKEDVKTFAIRNRYEYTAYVDEIEADRRMLRIAGAYIREHKLKCDKEGILLQVFFALCAKTFIYDYDEDECIKKEQSKQRRMHKKEKAKLQKRCKKKKH